LNSVEIVVRHDPDLDALGYFHYILEHNPDAAVRFLKSVDQTVEGLAFQPLKGRLRRFRGKDLKNIRSGHGVGTILRIISFSTGSVACVWKFFVSSTPR
jgi:plasmid stabilization system protein ParE